MNPNKSDIQFTECLQNVAAKQKALNAMMKQRKFITIVIAINVVASIPILLDAFVSIGKDRWSPFNALAINLAVGATMVAVFVGLDLKIKFFQNAK